MKLKNKTKMIIMEWQIVPAEYDTLMSKMNDEYGKGKYKVGSVRPTADYLIIEINVFYPNGSFQ